MTSINPFFFDQEKLESLADDYHQSFLNAPSFPHVVIDNFLPSEVADQILDDFPTIEKKDWEIFNDSFQKKLALNDETQMKPYIRQVISQFQSGTFINFLEKLTGIQGLIGDPHLEGGGLHQISKGGKLGIHVDYGLHSRLNLHRRLNFLLYLNKNWKEEYGGHIELWDSELTQCKKKALPIFNRCVIFLTSDFSYHGHPDPLACPEGWTRKSLAFYYFTKDRPDEEILYSHTTTLFKNRPGENHRRGLLIYIKQNLIPPIIINSARKIKIFFNRV